MAQFGRVQRSGRWGRWFESSHLDQKSGSDRTSTLSPPGLFAITGAASFRGSNDIIHDAPIKSPYVLESCFFHEKRSGKVALGYVPYRQSHG